MAGLLDWISQQNVIGAGKNALTGLLQPTNSIFDALVAERNPQKAKDIFNKKVLQFYQQAQTPEGALDVALNFAPLGITAWHGSPKIFDKFDIQKSGSGAGNDFGFGNYLSESPSVATKYMGDEERFITTVDGKEIDTPVLKSILRVGGNPNDYIKTLSKKLDEQQKLLASASKKEVLPGISDYDIAKLDYNSTLNKINEAKSYIGKDIKNQRAGNLYKVDLPDEQLPYFINWDSTQQTPEVIDILKKAGIYQPNQTGQDLYLNAIQKSGNSDAEKSGFQKASEYLNQLGIKGNKYIDRTYGTVAKNPTNYVVFDPNTIKILERNGLLVP